MKSITDDPHLSILLMKLRARKIEQIGKNFVVEICDEQLKIKVTLTRDINTIFCLIY